MAKRLFDIVAATAALIVLGPAIVVAAVGVKLCSRGPAFYCARRAGVGGRPFTLYKLRTMHVEQGAHAQRGHRRRGSSDICFRQSAAQGQTG